MTELCAFDGGSRFDHQRMAARAAHRDAPEPWSASSTGGMIATAHYLATAAGAHILEQGGNAFDAVIAAGVALGVVEPAGSGLGGMAMAVVHHAASSRTVAVHGPCRAPRGALPEVIATANRYRGHQAVAVPTYPAVLRHLLSYGRLSLDVLLAPAIELAEGGFPLTAMQAGLAREYRKVLRGDLFGQLLLDDNRRARPAGTFIRQPQLARTLRRLVSHGLDDYYQGAIAAQIDADMRAHGGFVDAADLAELPAPEERPCLEASLGNRRVHTIGPPAGGLVLGELCGLASAIGLQDLDLETGRGAVLLARLIRRVRFDRQRFRLRTGDDHIGEAAELLTERYAAEMATTIRNAVTVRALLGSPGETSHISVMDGDGNAIAMTQSIERSFGAGLACPDLGFLYNGYLRAFKVKNRQHPHFIRPGAVARSNAAPTLVLLDGRPVAAVGSTGSERMASGIFEVLLRLHRGADPFAAVHGPRLHCTPDGQVLLEADRFPTEVQAALTAGGFTLESLDAYAFKVGGLQLVVREGNVLTGVADPRRDGAAAGPRQSAAGC